MSRVLQFYSGVDKQSASDFLAELGKVPTGEPITVAINSGGGLVVAGDQIYNALRRHRGDVTIRIDAIAASAASYIAMAGDEIVMAPGSFLFMHNPSAEMAGTAQTFETAAVHMREIERRYAAVYSARSRQPEAKVRELMNAETWLSAEQAIQLGFADRLDDLLPIAAKVGGAIAGLRTAPPEVRAMVEAGAGKLKYQRTPEQRRRLKKRIALMALHAKLSPVEVERSARAQRRADIRSRNALRMAEIALHDQAQRVAAKARLEAEYYIGHSGVPRQQWAVSIEQLIDRRLAEAGLKGWR